MDEVFKANSAILNTLLTILNERLFDNGSQRLGVPLLCLVAASNELPESEELDALYDRFLVRKRVGQVRLTATLPLLCCHRTHHSVLQVSAGGLCELLQATVSADARAELTSALRIEDVRAVPAAAAAVVRVPPHVINLVVDLRTWMQDKLEPPAYVSDRRVVKALAMLQVWGGKRSGLSSGGVSRAERRAGVGIHQRAHDGERVRRPTAAARDVVAP